MAAISVRNLDDEVKLRLRERAARNGRSMESEIREILTEAVRSPELDKGIVDAFLEEFGRIGGVELDIPPRTEFPREIEF
ncbi:MAG: FitA-like ribbon-helix-helix domain-containing protein [Angustibacter sp.]